MPVDTDNIATFEQTTPRRPGLGDILNGTKTNATATVPPHIPAAEEFHQMAALLECIGRMVPLARVSITGGAAPVVQSAAFIRGDVVAADVTVVRNSAGSVDVLLPTGKFPAPLTNAVVSLNGSVGTFRAPAVEIITNGVRVHTANGGGTSADVDFTVEFY